MSTKNLINLGVYPDSGTGDSARRGGEKINNLFADIYANLGDNPVDNDTTSPTYGSRIRFNEFEFKVGELHPAGKLATVEFKTPTSKSGYISMPDAELGWDDTAISTTLGSAHIPDIYKDSEWYFLSRGEYITADLTEVVSGGMVHFVLPLAVAGDRIVIRDTFSTWKDKTLSVWTTPYDFQNTTQVSNWQKNAEGFEHLQYPDSDSVTITTQTGESYYVPYKSGASGLASTYEGIHQKFRRVDPDGSGISWTRGRSPFYIDDSDIELEFFYQGPDKGWRCLVKKSYFDLMSNSFQSIDSDLKYIGSGVRNTGRSNITANPTAADPSATTDGFLIDEFTLWTENSIEGFTTAKFITQARTTVDGRADGATKLIQSSEILVTCDGTNVFLTEYAIITNVNRITWPTDDLITYAGTIEDVLDEFGVVTGKKKVVIRAKASLAAEGDEVFVRSHRTAVLV